MSDDAQLPGDDIFFEDADDADMLSEGSSVNNLLMMLDFDRMGLTVSLTSGDYSV